MVFRIFPTTIKHQLDDESSDSDSEDSDTDGKAAKSKVREERLLEEARPVRTFTVASEPTEQGVHITCLSAAQVSLVVFW
jgi:hypothetical protein